MTMCEYEKGYAAGHKEGVRERSRDIADELDTLLADHNVVKEAIQKLRDLECKLFKDGEYKYQKEILT